jgi:hypothetical protein
VVAGSALASNEQTLAGDAPQNEEELRKMLDEVRIHSPQQIDARNVADGATSRPIETMHGFLIATGILNTIFCGGRRVR